jgi:hypothetical protein
MPVKATLREAMQYYAMGFREGVQSVGGKQPAGVPKPIFGEFPSTIPSRSFKPKRKLSAWNKYVKANSKKPRFRYRNGKLNLKKMAIAFRKTPAGRKKRR